MKKILTSSITATARQPFLDYSLSHLQESYSEALTSICKKILYDYTANDVVILEGLVDSGTAGVNFNISAGSVYYNGEVYQVAAASGTFSGTVAVLTETTSYHPSDPVQMDDGTTANVHQIKKFVISNAASG